MGRCGGGGQGGGGQVYGSAQAQAKQFTKYPAAFILLMRWVFLIRGDEKPRFVFVYCAEGETLSQPQGFAKDCVICAGARAYVNGVGIQRIDTIG